MLSTLLNQLEKNVKSLPGWIPLLLICYAASSLLDIDFIEDANANNAIKDSVAILSALFAYQLGDAIDKAFYRRFEGNRLADDRVVVREKLHITDGIYRIMKAYAGARGAYTGTWTQVMNEAAKLIRSLAVISIALGIIMLSWCQFWIGLGAVSLGTLCILSAFYLKMQHIRRLYNQIDNTVEAEEFHSQRLDGGIRLFFWDGELVGSAMNRSEPKTNPASTRSG
jgi:hypothetical protein